jgi:hypothetical protein
VAPKPEPARLASAFGTLTSVFGIVLSVAAILAIMAVSNTVLAHDIYSNLRDRDGHLCCNGQDCRPVEAAVLPDGNYYLPKTDEVIPADMATPSPDERFHHCIIIRWQMSLILGVIHTGTANPRRDVSLPR